MNLTLIRAVLKARRKGLLHLSPATEATRLDCLADACVKCCLNLGAPRVSEDEALRIDPAALTRTKAGCFVKSKGTACCLLDAGLCSIYARRPRGCIEYPWYNIGGRLYYDQGCPGIKHDRDERPNVADIQPFEHFFPGMPRVVVRLIRVLCTRR
ncbi:MAG: YkgJ family cysteine cluster protein [Phycisphaerae bacterium]|nr:YkgJ family cysteine cluster protein [Phycisphaerae bacterium]